MRKLCLVLLSGGIACGGSAGPSGPPGPTGPIGPSGDAAVSPGPIITAVLPRTFILGREVDVVIIGDNTSFTGKEALDFGSGVKASKITAIGPTSISAHVAIDATTTTGPRDLNVTIGADTVTAPGAVIVNAGVDIAVLGGTSQGSFVVADIANRDPQASFAAPKLYGGPFATIKSLYDSPNTVRHVAAIEPLATSGSTQVFLGNFIQSTTGTYVAIDSFYSAPDAVNVTARAATAVAPGAPYNGALANAYDSSLFKITTDGSAQILEVSIAPKSSSPFCPQTAMFGTSGKMDSYLQTIIQQYCQYGPYYSTAVNDIPLDAGAYDAYLILTDSSSRGGAGFDYTISATKIAATLVTEQSTPHGPGAEQNIGAFASPTIITGSLSAANEVDVYAFASTPYVNSVYIWSEVDNIQAGFPYDPANPNTYIYGASITPTTPPQRQLSSGSYTYAYNKYFIVKANNGINGAKPTGKYRIGIRF